MISSETTATHSNFYENISIQEQALYRFNRSIKPYVLFNIFFISLITIQLISIAVFLTFLMHSSLFALSLASLFLAFFSYYLLKIYFQTKRPLQIKEQTEEFVDHCKQVFQSPPDSLETPIAIANACCKLADHLHMKEYYVYRCPKIFKPLENYWEKFSCWWHWEDVFLFKEQLLKAAVREHLKLIRAAPIRLEFHASLANAYVMLSGLYLDPRQIEGFDEERWIPQDKYDQQMQKKFQLTAKKAIEEFKILSEYCPNDPWVHIQLAYSYHDLQMFEQEIKEYETILKLNPEDLDVLFKLGLLYFQQGHNVKGLQIYEKLKNSHYGKAEQLIQMYGEETIL